VTDLVAPIVNINGSTRAELFEQVRLVCEALTDAGEAMGKAMPHGRDYQVDPSKGLEARQAFLERRRALMTMKEEFEALALAIDRG
jgi:hypothetical protein